jgi:hypothetical protein
MSTLFDFETWEVMPITKKKPKKELSKKLFLYPTVHKEDQLPVNIIMPDLKTGPWIAGGACLRWFQNNPVGQHSDIDVFCKNEKQATRLIEYIKNEIGLAHFNGYSSTVFKSDNAHTFNIHGDGHDWKIQIITCRYFDNIQDVIDSFDLTVCQIATTGNEWILGDQTAKDINERNLRFKHITKQSPKRLIKYWTYGFNPVPGTIETIQQHETCSWNFVGSEDYDNTL